MLNLVDRKAQRRVMAAIIGCWTWQVKFWDELTEVQKWRERKKLGIAASSLPQYAYKVDWRGRVRVAHRILGRG